jgi:hypothetical protein
MIGGKMPTRRIAFVAVGLALTLALVPAALGKGKPGGGGGHGGGGGGATSCTQSAPAISVDNNWAWSGIGSWGLPGQQVMYAIQLMNYDIGCGSSSFVVSVSAPSGFSVSIPTNTISLNSSSSGYLWAYVTSPTTALAGNYPLTFTVTRAGTSSPSSSYTSYFKVYTSDSTAPTLFWQNPGEGQTITGRSYMVTVSSSDDHAVQKIELYMDGAYISTKACDSVTYICQLSYSWSGASGAHTATFKSTDWKGNVGALAVHFTVS